MKRLATAVVAMLALAACAPGAAVPPAGRLVFMVMSSGGMIPAVLAAMQSPALAIYDDGRVLTAVAAPALDLVPERYEVARIDPAAVRDFVAAAQSGGLFDGTDFGSPRVTDLATTTVLLDSGAGPAQVRVYALIEEAERGLTAAQREARSRLRELIGRAGALASGAVAEAYSPDRVVVSEPSPGRNENPAAVPWPGPPPSTFMTASSPRFPSCGELTGADARAVYSAALINPGARWLVGDATRVLAVNPLPLDGCG